MSKRIFALILALVMVMGSFSVFGTKTDAAAVKSGSTEAEIPDLVDDCYQIGTAEELLWFAQEVNGGNTGISGVLTEDIDLTEQTSWPGIGINHYPFSGSFDGQGHTVTFKEANWGMFGFVKGTSDAIVTIQNVKTAGSVRRTPIAHDVTFTHIFGCINRATVTNTRENYVGGIVGSVRYSQQGTTFYNDVLIENCGNEASITANDYVGGIMGSACYISTRIEGCYNNGNIHGNECVGGIVGWHQGYKGDNHIKNSYNTGRVTGSTAVAGIAGHLNNGVKVQNCYNAGSSTYAVIGRQYNTTNVISNCYFLGTVSAKSVPDFSTSAEQEPVYRAEAMTAAAMADEDFVQLLGDAYVSSCPYPVLDWQIAKEHTGTVCDNCALGSTETESYDVSFQDHNGCTFSGEAKAQQGKAYSFTVEINAGYETNDYNFAVKVNGEEIEPASDGSYTVLNVSGPLAVTVFGVQVIPGSHSIKLPGEGYGYRVNGEKTARRDEPYSFTLDFVDGFKAGDDFTVIAQEVIPQSDLDKGTKPYELELTGEGNVYTIPNVQKDYRIMVSGVAAVSKIKPVTVNFTVTEGWYEFHEPNDSGEIMIDMELTVPYFDLSLYGLEKYYYNPYCYVDENGSIRSQQKKGTPESAYDHVTVMHAFIAATELYYLGYSQDEVGTGISYQDDPEAFKEAISWSQDAGSSFMDFWDHGTNLNYYVNYAYPLAYVGWGSTSDQIEIQSGDIVSVHMITGQGSGSNFGFFTANDTNNKYNHGTDTVNTITVDQGEKVKLTYFWTSTSGNYDTKYVVQPNKQLYWVNADEDGIPGQVVPDEYEDEEGNPYYANGWNVGALGKNENLATDKNGIVTINTAGLEPGTYYIGGKGGFTEGGGKDAQGFVSAGYETGASFFKLVVEEYEGKTGDADGDTSITSTDAAIVLRYALGKEDDVNDAVADADGDMLITSTDAALILRYALGKLEEWP